MPKNNNEITNLLNLAEIKIDLISAGTWKGDGGVALGIMPKTLWGKFYPSDSENKILFDTNTSLIQTPKEKILVDTGFGNKLTQQQKKIFGISEYKLIKNLAYLNIRPEDIDYVILSHLHFDHAGGIVSSTKNKKKLTFPHATHLIQKKEWTMAKMPDFINKSSYHFNRDLALLEKSKQLSYKDLEVIPKRGDIKSINGRLLATTIPYYSIHMDTNTPSITNELFRENIDSLALCLSQLFKDKTASEYTKILRKARKKKKRYFLIHRNVTFPQLKKLQKFPIFRLGKYKGGLIIEGNDKRKKPFNLLASRTIGSISFNASGEKVGHSGLERAYDSYLRGEKGLQVIRRISGGRYMPVEQEVAPINGSEIISNINIKFQRAIFT